ncbi:TIGR01841 family phasin [Pararobbsia alpina]|uniref:Phasin domain-containing protein n=1 Tax=Pararobbsia alpina TaxID=621374 RepID=A0A6S7BGJ7_9BURK|nr:TIGR01841 family phasin [Pararobbsia alpina]CAB3799607.1 hypothetical protein LMG28138_04686 [Pararobbsia alpina]
MFPYFSQQASSGLGSNFQTYMNVTNRYMNGLQQLTELNVQTLRTVYEENTSILKAGSGAKPVEFLGWQSTLSAELPEKAAAYTRHFLSIIRATEIDILNETRSYYEQYGIDMKSVLESALRQSQSALQEPVERVSSLIAASTDAASETTDAASETAESALEASGATSQRTTNASASTAEGAASEAAPRSVKAGPKRQL